MSDGKIIGHINCPYCGAVNGMRVKLDKNGAPFGFCEANCDGQLRVGGKARRVEAFMKLHPHIAKAMQSEPEKPPVTVTAPKAPETKPAPANEPKPEPKKTGFTMEY